MITNLLSRYKPRYVRSLVYMLQSSEYDNADYFSWYHRTRNFSKVEKRKQLTMTGKARALLIFAWLIVIVLIAFALYLFSIHTLTGYVLGGLLLIFTPYLLAYIITAPLFVIHLIQKPIEDRLVNQAKMTLSRHRGIKIAIAGSFGKTTMREILKMVLSEGKKVAAPPHSYNTPLGISSFIEKLSGDEDVLLFELGEYYPGDVRKLAELTCPDIGVITGINEAHLQKFKTLDRTVSTIYELADYLGKKLVYVNGENALAKEHAWPSHILYSREGTKDLKIEDANTGLEGTSFTLVRNGKKIPFTSKLLGIHQVGPLAAAADIAFHLGLTTDQVQTGIAKTKPFAHRLQARTDEGGVITLDDSYNGNSDGVRAVIDFMATLKGHRRFYVTPGLVEAGARTAAVHIEIGTWLAQSGIEKVVLIRDSVTPFIEQGLKSAGYKGEVLWFDDALKTYSALPRMTVSGDVVLLQNDWPDQYA